MTPTQFSYWLKGFFELREGDKTASQRQIEIIKDHLNLVFSKVTPIVPAPTDDPAPDGNEEKWHTLLPEAMKDGRSWVNPPTENYCGTAVDLNSTMKHQVSC